ncbi:MAG: hypothetical protein ABSE82_13435 [Nitrososphaerales archaeon]
MVLIVGEVDLQRKITLHFALVEKQMAVHMTIAEYLKAEGYQLAPILQDWFAKAEKDLPIEVQEHLARRDGDAQLVEHLPKIVPLSDVARPEGEGVWQACGYFYYYLQRYNQALGVFSAMYAQMLTYQLRTKKRIHKGMPLVRMSECHSYLNHPAWAKRYLMLTACEDAIRGKGLIDPWDTGIYFRLVWERGFSHQLLDRYAREMWKIAQTHPRESLFPEWLLQELDQDWMIEFPSVEESGLYFATIPYLQWLLGKLGSGRGKVLERLAHYLVSLMPGCRAYMRSQTYSTDYDVVGIPEGLGLDFRSELGRYFLCECKDWQAKADFTTIAKFCRVLDGAKCSFGILFSKHGITGTSGTTDAAREQIKVFQQRGMVVVIISEADIQTVAEGANFITMLRKKYEQVRLDLRATKANKKKMSKD